MESICPYSIPWRTIKLINGDLLRRHLWTRLNMRTINKSSNGKVLLRTGNNTECVVLYHKKLILEFLISSLYFTSLTLAAPLLYIIAVGDSFGYSWRHTFHNNSTRVSYGFHFGTNFLALQLWSLVVLKFTVLVQFYSVCNFTSFMIVSRNTVCEPV